MAMADVIFRNAVEVEKVFCQQKLGVGEVAVDCTMGNGNDTAFLCELVGEEGKVYAFDIQESAIENTKRRLEDLGFEKRAQLILDGHEKVDQYVKERVQFIIFNLGYLPKGDHSITTKKETTLEAVEKGLGLLKKNGIMLLVLYPGHESGREEREELLEMVASLEQRRFGVFHLRYLNQINNPPEILCIEKIKE